MEQQKIKISVIDFLPEQGKHKIGHKDKNGNELHIGDTVSYNDENWIIVYRYGKYLLKKK